MSVCKYYPEFLRLFPLQSPMFMSEKPALPVWTWPFGSSLCSVCTQPSGWQGETLIDISKTHCRSNKIISITTDVFRRSLKPTESESGAFPPSIIDHQSPCQLSFGFVPDPSTDSLTLAVSLTAAPSEEPCMPNKVSASFCRTALIGNGRLTLYRSHGTGLPGRLLPGHQCRLRFRSRPPSANLDRRRV